MQGSRQVEGYPWVAEAEGEPIEGPYMICYKQYHKRQSDAILADPTRATGFAQHPTVTGGNPINALTGLGPSAGGWPAPSSPVGTTRPTPSPPPSSRRAQPSVS